MLANHIFIYSSLKPHLQPWGVLCSKRKLNNCYNKPSMCIGIILHVEPFFLQNVWNISVRFENGLGHTAGAWHHGRDTNIPRCVQWCRIQEGRALSNTTINKWRDIFHKYRGSGYRVINFNYNDTIIFRKLPQVSCVHALTICQHKHTFTAWSNCSPNSLVRYLIFHNSNTDIIFVFAFFFAGMWSPYIYQKIPHCLVMGWCWYC